MKKRKHAVCLWEAFFLTASILMFCFSLFLLAKKCLPAVTEQCRIVFVADSFYNSVETWMPQLFSPGKEMRKTPMQVEELLKEGLEKTIPSFFNEMIQTEEGVLEEEGIDDAGQITKFNGGELKKENTDFLNQDAEEADLREDTSPVSSDEAEKNEAGKTDEKQETAEKITAVNEAESEAGKTVEEVSGMVSFEELKNYDTLLNKFYTVDATTRADPEIINAQKLMEKDLHIKGSNENPQILIYHTHSQECYADSVEGDPSTSVVAVGERLKQILNDKYALNVLHDTGEYDKENRDNAYSRALPEIERILEENPSIEVVIDLHRDGVAEGVHLVTEIDGKKMAQIMFFNGMSYSNSMGKIEYLNNPYIEDNLAFSFQMMYQSSNQYPTLARCIYLKCYRYNLHVCPRSLLLEVGAQTNTFEEALNSMEPVAEILHQVLQG